MLIPNIFKETLTGFRTAAGSYVNGLWVDGAETSFTIEGSSQPLTSSELNAQLTHTKEGSRKKEFRKVYTNTILNSVDEINKIPADQVVINGVRFEVQTVHNHTANSNNHIKVILARDSE